ncbi:MAG: tryptophan synthase subunit alpha [Acidobacteria bacterium]|nr:MAG: tryptophan synthase subunit alpha [Acidobacteriota bacterium]PYY23596.1 MAG: tryptophan synthase subunit alpha [Acidobacteriota bacterium]
MIAFENQPGLVAYLTCGDPDLATSRAVALAAIDAGADVLELGIPFSDPVADGPVIQRASERALRCGTSLTQCIALGAELRKARPKAGLIIFSYLNPVLRVGISSFTQQLTSAGIDGALITDLTIEEATEYIETMHAHNLATVFLVAPTSTDARLKTIAEQSRGFVYALSRTGITGEQQQIAADAAQLVARVRRFSSMPIAVGFGISNAQQFQAVGEFADAAVIGSAIVNIVEKHGRNSAEPVANFIRGLRTEKSVAQSGALTK